MSVVTICRLVMIIFSVFAFANRPNRQVLESGLNVEDVFELNVTLRLLGIAARIVVGE